MYSWRPVVAIVVLFLVSVNCARADSVDDFIKSEMTKQQIPGLTLAVIRNRKPIKVKAYGFADADQRTPVSLDTLFEVGSVAKPFTAAAVLMLVEKGKLRLTDPLSRFFADLPKSWQGITVWHLLSNTSGIRDYTSEIPTTAVLDFTPDLIYHRAIGAPLNFPPGTQFKYSHTNFVLLGMIIEASTGRPFCEYVNDHIFKPLEMTHSQPDAARKPGGVMATGYKLVDGQRTPAEYEKRGFGDAFFSSTINDMVNWAMALDTGTILSGSSRTIMWTPTTLAPLPTRKPAPEAKPKIAPYGAGWYTESLNGHLVLGHAGSVSGFSANLSRFPDDHLTVIMLMNLKDVKVFPMIRAVAGRYSAALK